jgi:hypothetical protein
MIMLVAFAIVIDQVYEVFDRKFHGILLYSVSGF